MESQAHANVKNCGNAQQDKHITNGECGGFEQRWTEAELTHADLGLETVLVGNDGEAREPCGVKT
jgi:hypothetical protein